MKRLQSDPTPDQSAVANTFQETGEAIAEAGNATEQFQGALTSANSESSQQNTQPDSAQDEKEQKGQSAETPVSTSEITGVIGAKAALAVREAGYTTREKIATAPVADLVKLKDVGPALANKLHAWATNSAE